MSNIKNKWIQIRVDVNTHRIIKEFAEAENTTISDFILNLVNTHILKVETQYLTSSHLAVYRMFHLILTGKERIKGKQTKKRYIKAIIRILGERLG